MLERPMIMTTSRMRVTVTVLKVINKLTRVLIPNRKNLMQKEQQKVQQKTNKELVLYPMEILANDKDKLSDFNNLMI